MVSQIYAKISFKLRITNSYVLLLLADIYIKHRQNVLFSCRVLVQVINVRNSTLI